MDMLKNCDYLEIQIDQVMPYDEFEESIDLFFNFSEKTKQRAMLVYGKKLGRIETGYLSQPFANFKFPDILEKLPEYSLISTLEKIQIL